MKHMSAKLRLSACLAAVSSTLFAAPLFDVDFGQSAKRVDGDGKGSFHGVLPANVSENFASWSTG